MFNGADMFGFVKYFDIKIALNPKREEVLEIYY